MVLQALKNLCQQLQVNKPLHITSPSDQPRRASVAAIFRCRSSIGNLPSGTLALPTTAEEFFTESWVTEDIEPELLFIQRATRQSDRWSGHVAFPGGKNEPGETDTDTVERETLEEVGLDLSSSSFIRIGQLDDREITSSATGKLMMILTPFVYLQVVHETPALTIQESEVATVQWVPLRFFLSPTPYPDQPIIEPLVPARRRDTRLIAPITRIMLGTVSFPAIDLPTDKTDRHMRLWGLTLGMTRELIEITGKPDNNEDDESGKSSGGRPAWQQKQFVAMATAFPRFSSLDVQWLVKFYMLFIPRNARPIRTLSKSTQTKAYITALRRAVVTAVLLRFAVVGAGLGYTIGHKLLKVF